MTPFHRANTRGAPSPLVEAITKHKGEWQVNDIEFGGATNNLEQEMWVPLDDDECLACGGLHNEAIRGHELLHAKLSPESYGPVKVRIGDKEIPVSAANIEVAEEYRINWSLAHIEGMNQLDSMYCHPAIQPQVAALLDQGKYQDVVRMAIAGGPGFSQDVDRYLTDYIDSLDDKFRKAEAKTRELMTKKRAIASALTEAIPSYSSAAHRIMSRRDGALPSWSQVEELAAFLEVNLKELNRQIQGMFETSPPDFDILDQFLYEEGDDDDSPLGPSYEVDKEGGKLVAGEGKVVGEEVRWGVPDEITEAKMPLSVPAWKLQRANRAVEEGTIPRYMHRWPTDKRVFHRTKRLPGGTLLIDDSSSMGLSAEQLNEIIEAAPVATVAIYAGNDGYDGGEIRVVAKDGKRAKAEDLSITRHGGNGIDGPALEWLGSQEYPRIWVTDGGVTAVNYSYEKATIDAAKKLCLKHKVTVVETAEDAAAVLKSGRFAR